MPPTSPRRTECSCRDAWAGCRSVLKLPVVFDLIYDRVRSRWLTFMLLCMFIDQLYLRTLTGTPSCSEVWASVSASSSSGGSNSSSVNGSVPVLFLYQRVIVQPLLPHHTATPHARHLSDFSDASSSLGAWFRGVFDVSDDSRSSIARYVAIPVASLSNTRYAHPALLPIAGVAMTAYVGLYAADELSACGALGAYAAQLQASAPSASGVIPDAGVNSSSTNFTVPLPASFAATGAWLVVFQSVGLWLVALLASICVWWKVVQRLAAGHVFSCVPPRKRARSHVLPSTLQLDTASLHSALAGEASSSEEQPVLRYADTTWGRVSGTCLRAELFARTIPQRVQVALGLAVILLLVVAITIMSQLGSLAVWVRRVLDAAGAIRGIAAAIVDAVTGSDNTGSTAQLVDAIANITTITLEAVYALLVALVLGAVFALVVSLIEIVRAVRRYHIAHLELVAARDAKQHAAAAVAATSDVSPLPPLSPLPSPPAADDAAAAGRSSCCCSSACCRAALAPFTVWTHPGGLLPDGSLDLHAFAYYTAMGYIPFQIVNTLLAFLLLYVLVAALAFVVLFAPLRNFVLGYVIAPAAVASVVDWILRRLLFTYCLADARRIRHPRCFLFFDFLYSMSLGIVSGFMSALLRVLQGAAWSAWRCMQLDEPLLPGPLAYLDAGWCMHGAVMKCAYLNGVPPSHYDD